MPQEQYSHNPQKWAPGGHFSHQYQPAFAELEAPPALIQQPSALYPLSRPRRPRFHRVGKKHPPAGYKVDAGRVTRIA